MFFFADFDMYLPTGYLMQRAKLIADLNKASINLLPLNFSYLSGTLGKLTLSNGENLAIITSTVNYLLLTERFDPSGHKTSQRRPQRCL